MTRDRNDNACTFAYTIFAFPILLYLCIMYLSMSVNELEYYVECNDFCNSTKACQINNIHYCCPMNTTFDIDCYKADMKKTNKYLHMTVGLFLLAFAFYTFIVMVAFIIMFCKQSLGYTSI